MGKAAQKTEKKYELGSASIGWIECITTLEELYEKAMGIHYSIYGDRADSPSIQGKLWETFTPFKSYLYECLMTNVEDSLSNKHNIGNNTTII
jgi:hypothetical protein